MGRPDSLLAVIVYGIALVLLFLFSALHHAVSRPRIKHLLLGLDHSGIYLLIAGTYTPFCLLMPRGEGGLYCHSSGGWPYWASPSRWLRS